MESTGIALKTKIRLKTQNVNAKNLHLDPQAGLE